MIEAAASEARKTVECRDLIDRYELLGWLRGEQHVPDHLLFGDAARLGSIGNLLFYQRRQHVAWANGVDRDAALGDL